MYAKFYKVLISFLLINAVIMMTGCANDGSEPPCCTNDINNSVNPSNAYGYFGAEAYFGVGLINGKWALSALDEDAPETSQNAMTLFTMESNGTGYEEGVYLSYGHPVEWGVSEDGMRLYMYRNGWHDGEKIVDTFECLDIVEAQCCHVAINGIDNGELFCKGIVTSGEASGSDSSTVVSDSGNSSAQSSSASIEREASYVYAYDDGVHGTELWWSDANGSRLITDLSTDTHASRPSYVTRFRDKFIFNADDGIHGYEPYISDGTVEGTHLLKDINPGSDDSYPYSFTTFKDRVYFGTREGLYVSDGTVEGTVKIFDIFEANNFTVLGDKLIFIATDADPFPPIPTREAQSASSSSSSVSLSGHYGYELWVTDGTSMGTHLLKDINPGAGWGCFSSIHVLNGHIYFAADDGAHGTELWQSDGTSEGTVMLKDINPGAGTSNLSNFNAVVFKDHIYFNAFDGKDTSLWSSDGTEAGTLRFTGIDSGLYFELYANHVATDDDHIYFCGSGGIYRSNGTPESLELLTTATPDAIYLFGDKLFMINRYSSGHYSPIPGPYETQAKIDVYDMTKMATKRLIAFDPGSYISGWIEHKDDLYFVESNSTTQRLHRTDGTTITAVAQNEGKLLGCCFYNELLSYNDQLIVSLQDDSYDEELWYFDEETSSFALLKDINVVTKDASPKHITWWNGSYYFVVHSDTRSTLYKTDGTEAGTKIVTSFDIEHAIQNIYTARDFMLIHTINGLWAVQESDNSIELLFNEKGKAPFRISKVTSVGSKLLFNTYGSENAYYEGYNLWSTDGTPSGTQLVIPQMYVDTMTAVGDRVFFIGRSDTYGKELFVSDGSEVGTHLVKDINPGNANAMNEPIPDDFGMSMYLYETGLYGINGMVYFGAFDGTDFSLWKSDGSESGTIKIKDITISNFINIRNFKNDLYYIDDYATLMKLSAENDMSIPLLYKVRPYNTMQTDTALFYRKVSETNSSVLSLWATGGAVSDAVEVHPLPDNIYSPLCNLKSHLFFYAGKPKELWASDGTVEGTEKLFDDSVKVQNCYTIDGMMMLRTYDNVVYQTDGTSSATKKL